MCKSLRASGVICEELCYILLTFRMSTAVDAPQAAHTSVGRAHVTRDVTDDTANAMAQLLRVTTTMLHVKSKQRFSVFFGMLLIRARKLYM